MNDFSVAPQITIEIDGTPLESEIIQTIREIRIKQMLSAPTQCEILLPSAHEKLFSEILFKIGSDVHIKIGQIKKHLFYGHITAVEYLYSKFVNPLISIRAYDLLHQLRKHQPVRVHVHVNFQQLAQELTQDLGIQVLGGEITPVKSRLFQYNQSDFQLLHDVGESCGQYFFLNKDCLQITSLEGTNTDQVLTLGGNLFEAQFSLNAETITDSLTVTGWNLQRTTSHSKTIEASVARADVQNALVSSNFDFKSERTIVDYCAQDEDQADVVAQAEFDKHTIRQVTLKGVVEGNPELIPGVAVQVAGVATSLAGQYVLTEVIHSIDSEKGFISQISTSPPAPAHIKTGKNATIGIVSQVNDPDNLGRIKVCLPTYNSIETDWLEVLSLGAGSNKGQLIVPDVGDNVLLLFVNNEPSQSIVLGGLYGEKDLPGEIIKDGSVIRFVTQTPGNQRVSLDDSDDSIRLKTKSGHSINITPNKINITRDNGSFISLTNELISIHSESDLVIEAPGNSITFRSSRVDFEET
ncbi:phage baseplate assembly protein V [Nitrosomonas sp.]|uniref:phage baseplate assembly protein V n=1 Tax=Nitrosomonas sp. TaxID=42353 RepID=UPI0032EFB5E9